VNRKLEAAQNDIFIFHGNLLYIIFAIDLAFWFVLHTKYKINSFNEKVHLIEFLTFVKTTSSKTTESSFKESRGDLFSKK
jgi:NADH:ubiquinone oxidoreductase subunit 3 (subunit A)